MSETIETVKVEADNEYGYMIINKSDMKDSDKIYSERKEAPAATTATKRGK